MKNFFFFDYFVRQSAAMAKKHPNGKRKFPFAGLSWPSPRLGLGLAWPWLGLGSALARLWTSGPAVWPRLRLQRNRLSVNASWAIRTFLVWHLSVGTSRGALHHSRASLDGSVADATVICVPLKHFSFAPKMACNMKFCVKGTLLTGGNKTPLVIEQASGGRNRNSVSVERGGERTCKRSGNGLGSGHWHSVNKQITTNAQCHASCRHWRRRQARTDQQQERHCSPREHHRSGVATAFDTLFVGTKRIDHST